MAPVRLSEFDHIIRRHILDAGKLQQIQLLIFKGQAVFLDVESKKCA
jgi:hypothetical protein